MSRGSKEKYTEKQKRKAEHIEESYEEKGLSKDNAEARAWATVNKQSGGGEKSSGSGSQKRPEQKKRARKDSARQAAETRKGNTQEGKLEQKTKDQLLAEARRMDIEGRSKMRKQDLIAAIKRQR
ncbi:Rho termination factor N-terminal domain-containing protein [Kineobactrum salinum]|uniref:Termination factor Rho n=1 Tax=Kineobactrum salinum TaxID=2708301 RepID=A0A6C0TXK5_9GAMM|nr:Rho termination factor N-terminal domain-containing protein [Kineobactrum salinum]QIB64562.1 termination factor Rho [Kineobactrum salinum]